MSGDRISTGDGVRMVHAILTADDVGCVCEVCGQALPPGSACYVAPIGAGTSEYCIACAEAISVPADAVRRPSTVTVAGERWTERVVRVLVRRSMWFAVEPLPDDAWEIMVANENAERLVRIVAEVAR